MGVSVKQAGNKQIIVVDCSNMKSNQSDLLTKTLEEGSALVATKPEKSVFIITNVTNTQFNTQISDVFKKYASSNTNYVKKSVLVGLNGFQTIIFSAIKALTNREYHLADTIDEALKYMETV
jgi:hypothetical protein